MKYLCWFLLGDPRATGPGQQSVQNSGMFTSHKVLASFCIYLLNIIMLMCLRVGL